MKLARRREGRKGRKDAVIALLFPIFTPSFPDFFPVIPAKAGIQKAADAVGTLASAICQRAPGSEGVPPATPRLRAERPHPSPLA